MNSMSKVYYNDPCGKDRIRPERDCPTIMKCGCHNSIPVPEGTESGATFTVTSTTLDTSCLCNPCIKLEFASNLVADGFTGTLSFQVFKQCKNQFNAVPIGPSWVFTADALDAAQTFSFLVCDCDLCCTDCCTYTVIATATAATATTGTLNINNATLAVTAVCNPNRCC